jgi:hypothetical protein
MINTVTNVCSVQGEQGPRAWDVMFDQAGAATSRWPWQSFFPAVSEGLAFVDALVPLNLRASSNRRIASG